MAYDDFRVLTTIGQKEQIEPLLVLSLALAKHHDGAVTVLCVTRDGARPSWLDIPVERDGVSIRTVVRAGRNAAKVILEASTSLRPDLLIMGWSGEPGQRSYLLGSTLDPVTRYAACDVAVVRIDDLPKIRRALVPMSSGPNAPLALALALQLADDIQVIALHVAKEALGPTALAVGQAQLTNALEPWQGDERISAKVVRAPGITDGILEEAASGYDLILIGASNESYVDRKLFGDVPQTIAAEAAIPTVIVRHRAGPLRLFLRQAERRLARLDGSLSVEQQVETYREVRRGSRSRPDFYVLIGLAAAIATFGLLMNSAAIIIGAMVIAPLMSAILGVSLGVVQGDNRLLWRAIYTTLRGAGLAVLVGALIAVVVPGKQLTPEILGRTQPTLFDLGVALLSGIAGAYAQCRRDVLSAVSGVAIAVALVPPLATAGIGITMMNGPVATGALLLFVTNLSAIIATGSLLFLYFGFRPDPGKRFRVFGQSAVGVIVLLVAVSIILSILTAGSFRDARRTNQIQGILDVELAQVDGLELEEWQLHSTSREAVALSVRIRADAEVPRALATRIQTRLTDQLGQQVALTLWIVPVTRIAPTPAS